MAAMAFSGSEFFMCRKSRLKLKCEVPLEAIWKIAP
jgi:hypothetical protein